MIQGTIFLNPPNDRIQAGLQKFLLHTIEDQGTVLAPLLLIHRIQQKMMILQDLIDDIN